MDHNELIRLIVAYTLAGAFVFTVIVTCLSLVGIVKFADAKQQKTLFRTLIVEVVVICVGWFADLLEFNPAAPKDRIVEQVAELQVYLTRCSDGVGEACNSAAFRIGDGKGAPVDFEKSAELYLRACELGSGRGCRNYGRRLKLGKGLETDLEAAKSYYARACELNYAKACQELESL